METLQLCQKLVKLPLIGFEQEANTKERNSLPPFKKYLMPFLSNFINHSKLELEKLSWFLINKMFDSREWSAYWLNN